MKTATSTLALAAGIAVAALASPAAATDQGDFTLGFGLGLVSPQAGNSTTTAGQINVDDNIRPTLTFEYFVADKIGIELLASWPFEHDINLVGAGRVAKTKHLPPTLSIKYHFANQSSVTPFVDVGLNYTHFFDESGVGALAGANVSLDDSWGVAAVTGADFAISDRGALRAELRYIDIESDVKINGANIGKVKIDPLVLNVAYVLKF